MNDISAAASTLYKINKYKVVAVVIRAGAPNWMRKEQAEFDFEI